jgi:hypothetical protein
VNEKAKAVGRGKERRVETGDGAAMFLGGQQYAAVGQLATDIGAEPGELGSGFVAQRKLGDPESIESRDYAVEAIVLAPKDSAPVSASRRRAWS